MKPLEIVALCSIYDLQEWYEPHIAQDNPWLRLIRPDQVTDPTTIRHALAFSPGPEDFDRYPNLELVSSAGAGVDGILKHPGLRPDIQVSRVIVKEQAQMITGFALWYIVGWQRQMWEYKPLQQKKDWSPVNRTPPSQFPVGILGYGKIGATLARTLHNLGHPVIAYGSRNRIEDGLEIISGPDGLKEVANRSLAVVNLLPLTEDTENILNTAFFKEMQPEAILIQLGRGGHLVEEDLTQALSDGQLARAALDVFAHEPLSPDHPFWQDDRIFVTPHVAGDANFRDTAKFIAEGIAEFENGAPPAGHVDRTRGY